MKPLPTTPSGQTQALAAFAFGSQTRVADTSRPLAWLSPEELDIDLSDPVQRRFGDYELLEKIGQGGMGVVYRARQHGLERDVALKLLAAGPWASNEFVERFRREARSAARMQHPNIVEIYEFGHRDGLNFFSMRLIDGRSLAQQLAASGPLQARDAAVLLRTLAEAMDYAHRLGVLHLDLKPANVLLSASGAPLIADFGLARRIDAGHEGGNGEISGTPSYMAPEQALLESHPLSASTDIYGLGAVLYECLTGRAPFFGSDSQAVLARVVAEAPATPRAIRPEVPADLEAICLKCLEKDPAQRYASARAMADDLGRFIEGRPVSVRPLGAMQRAHRWLRREPRLAAALGIAMFALLSGAAATTWQWRQAVAQRNAAEQSERRAGAERDRAKIAGEIGAYLFAHADEAEDSEKLARGLVDWLRQRWPGDDRMQADALTAFASAVGDEQEIAADELLAGIVRVLGADYRQAVIKSLQARNVPYRHLYSAMLAWGDTQDGGDSSQFESSLRAAVRERPDDVPTLHTAAVYCPSGKCLFPDAAADLVRVDPDNMYHWLLLAISSAEASEKRAAVHEAARRTRYDDYLALSYLAYSRAIDAAKVPVPPLLARPLTALAPNARPELSIALDEAHRIPIAIWSPLVRFCVPPDLSKLDPQLRKDCMTIGERMARSNDALISQMIGVALVRNLAPGTPIAAEMQQIRAHYQYLGTIDDQLTPQQRSSYATQRYLDDMVEGGEMLSMQRRVEFFGLPGQVPAGWKPKDASVLLTGRERGEKLVAIHDEGNRLLARGDFAAAFAVLAPAESETRGLGGREAWRLPAYLISMGKAQTGRGNLDAAEKYLLEAWEIVESYGPGAPQTRGCAQALLALYEAKQKAAADRNSNAKVAEWKQVLAELGEAGAARAGG